MKFSRSILKNLLTKKRIKSSISTAVSIALFFLSGNIKSILIETNHIEDVLLYVQSPTTLVVFDLDNTVFESPYDFGGDRGFHELLVSQIKKGLSMQEAVKNVLPVYVEIQRMIQLRLVEPIVRTIIANLQKEHIPVIALSSRSVPIEERTIEQLTQLGIDFSSNALSAYDIDLSMEDAACYKKGIIFCGQNSKGKILQGFLDYLGIKPSRIIFIDDKEKYLKDVQSVLTKDIDFVGIRYGAADEMVKKFNPLIAEAQLTAFRKQFNLDKYFGQS